MKKHRKKSNGRREIKTPSLQITKPMLEKIYATVGRLPAEHGGALGGSREDGIVRYYHFDDTAQRTGATYSPNHRFLNQLFKEQWNPKGINLLGFVHSHPPGVRRPSYGDVIYAERILEYIPELDRLLLPIVISEANTGRFEILPYAAIRDGNRVRIEEMKLVVINEEEITKSEANEASQVSPVSEAASPTTRFDDAETFKRVQNAYDLKHLARCRVIYIGAGGAANFIEEMARAGVGEHVLIDPDIVSETNLATQQVYRKDIGRPKVDCISERIRDINPNAVVKTFQLPLNDLDDMALKKLAFAPLNEQPPIATLLCGLTDNFYAQARVNRLGLKLGVPTLSAQVYLEGRGAEITFTYPGVTPACQRCAVSSRYAYYLDKGFENNVTSDGTPIFATTRLNALKGFIAMAILHHETEHPRWGELLERIGNRNLIQIRMDPDLASTLRLGVFDKVFGEGDQERILFDEVVWLPQKPDCPENGYAPCPDCGGTGNLRDATGNSEDTRIIRK